KRSTPSTRSSSRTTSNPSARNRRSRDEFCERHRWQGHLLPLPPGEGGGEGLSEAPLNRPSPRPSPGGRGGRKAVCPWLGAHLRDGGLIGPNGFRSAATPASRTRAVGPCSTQHGAW